MPSVRSLLAIALLALTPRAAFADDAEAAPVSFRKDIAPLLQRRCVTCHGEDSAKGGYRLDSFAALAKAGESELPALTAGQPQKSELYQLLVESDPQDRMPQRADALPAREIALVERWIAQGARNDAGAPERPLAEVMRETLLLPAPAHYPRPVPVTALAFGPQGTQLLSAGYYEVLLWEADSGRLARRIGGLPERITAVAWNVKRNLVAVAGGSPAQWGSVWIIDPAAGWQPRLLCDLAETALAVAFSPDGSKLLAAAGDRTIRQFDPASGKQTRIWKSHADWVQTVCFSTDGAQFLAASRDRTARIYDTASGEALTRYDGHEAAVLTAVFPPRPSSVFSVARGQFVQQWDAESGKRKVEITDAGRGVQTLLATDTGLLTGAIDGGVRLVQLSDLKVQMSFHGHRDAIEALALAPDRQSFASGDHSGLVCVWNFGCEAPVRSFLAQP